MSNPNRKIYVPGVSAGVHTIIADTKNNTVLAIYHAGEVIIVFFSAQHSPSARIMTTKQAEKFGSDLIAAHQALTDDAKIAQMEKEFEDDE